MASVGRIFKRSNNSKKRHTPTRMPYSCQLQFGTSGSCVTPVGGASTWRAIGLPMSQTSRLTMVQNTRRAPFGSFSGGRSTIAEKSARSRGSIGLALFFFRLGFAIPTILSCRFALCFAAAFQTMSKYMRLCAQTIAWPWKRGNFPAIFVASEGAITSLLEGADRGLQSAAEDSSMEPGRRGLIIFPVFENPLLKPHFADLCHAQLRFFQARSAR